MKSLRNKIYVRVEPQESVFICSGIEFSEFIKYVPNPPENLMAIQMGCNIICLDASTERGFELFEGRKQVEALTEENLQQMGDFCFVDYDEHPNLLDLTEGEIAELLYMSHTFQPLHSSFFDVIQNRFAYLSHDNGWYSKVYCRDLSDMVMLFLSKVFERQCVTSDESKRAILRLMEQGLLVELPVKKSLKGEKTIELDSVGCYENMDHLRHNWEHTKNTATELHQLELSKNQRVHLK